MIDWTRATHPTKCGLCGKDVGRGAPLLVIRVAAISQRRYRCEHCAEEPVAFDLPDLREPEPTVMRPATVPQPELFPRGAMADLARDWKKQAGGDG